jgi:hypothetical protein
MERMVWMERAGRDLGIQWMVRNIRLLGMERMVW